MKRNKRKKESEVSQEVVMETATALPDKSEKKKRKSPWSSRMVQNVICLLAFVVMVTDIIGFVLFASYNEIYSMDEIVGMSLIGDYEDSEMFWDTFVKEAEVRINVEVAEQMYTDLNVVIKHGQTQVDLGYVDHVKNGDELTGITYYLIDLITWEDFALHKMSEEFYSHVFAEKIKNPDYWINFDVLRVDNYDYECLVNEQYFPVGSNHASLYTYAENPDELEEYSQKLFRTIRAIQEMNRWYYVNLSHYNMHAAVITDQGVIFSSDEVVNRNLPVVTLNAQYQALAEESGKYLIFINGGEHVETNIAIPAERSYLELSYYVEDVLQLGEGDSLYLWVDDSYAGNDAFNEGLEYYQNEVVVMRKILVVFAISLFLFLVSLVRRIILEAREGQKERKIRNWKTEFILVECGVAGVGLFGIAYHILMGFGRYLDSAMAFVRLSIGLGIVCSFLFAVNMLYFVMELIRRIKEHTFIRKSLSYMMIRLMVRITKGVWKKACFLICAINGKVRWGIGYLVFLLVNLFAVLSQNGAVVILMLIVDLAIGFCVLMYFKEQDRLRAQMKVVAEGKEREKLDVTQFHLANRESAEHINAMDMGIKKAVDISMRDERMKTELITNVSHDIKTPLTSIITYVDLLAKEPLQTDNEKQYVEILAQKSNRLKQLIDDLMEASKINSGNIAVISEQLCMGELIAQISAEYENRLAAKQLQIVCKLPEEPLYFKGDSRHVWRVFSNLFSNICKYAMPGTRVYLEAEHTGQARVYLEVKNISEKSLNISPEELTERFVRGDESRNTEGNGLGLSIAGSLMQTMGGEMELAIDGDLFKVKLIFPE